MVVARMQVPLSKTNADGHNGSLVNGRCPFPATSIVSFLMDNSASTFRWSTESSNCKDRTYEGEFHFDRYMESPGRMEPDRGCFILPIYSLDSLTSTISGGCPLR